MVVGVLTSQNAASAGAAQRRDSKLQEGNRRRTEEEANRGTERETKTEMRDVGEEGE